MYADRKEKPFSCERDGLTIRGMQYFPENFKEDQKYPAAIVSHGFMGNYLSMADWCRDFAGIGYMAFSFSFCGSESVPREETLESDGKSTEMTISSEIADLLAVKDFVKKQTCINVEELILVGGSQGGFVSGLTAAKCGTEIKKLILFFPALCIPDHARRGCLGGSSYQPENVPEVLDCGNILLGRCFHEDVVQMEPYSELSVYPGPVLLLQGLADDIVNYSYAIRAKESYGKGQCHLQLVQNMGHGFNEEQHQSAFASVRQFLAGRKEILTIRIIITRKETLTEGDRRTDKLFFTGYCETEYFRGTVLPGGCDIRKHDSGIETQVRAEYTLEGLDKSGKTCRIHIVNVWGENDWKPAIQTDSTELLWMNHAELTAVVEGGDAGPTIRIFGKEE